MLSVPLPFIAGLVFAIVVYRSLNGVEAAGPRHTFLAFILLYALQGMIVGLRFGYGIHALAFIQPVTAAVMPPLAFLAFRSLSGSRPSRPFLHAAAPVAVGLSVAFLRDFVDALLLAIFFGYGLALYRLTFAGDEAAAEASLHRARPVVRAARLTAGLMLFFALSDGALAAYTAFYGNARVPAAVGLMNLVVIAAVLGCYLLPEGVAETQPIKDRDPPSGADSATLARIDKVLEEGALYRDENLSLARLARKAGLPPREVSVVINRATGFNLAQFVNNRRVAEVCRLLKETKMPLTEIMFEAGFSTKSNFNREFRRVTGVSPSRYRTEALSGQADAPKTRT
ncbi:AraC family transcriptional regulator [Pararhizobium sp. BT-229]|uniref:helix-turn-helix domain-containing protein n=1 Tax=Pararhizobium sp. BT-229 TaxID=2986923 RepID=UPI0021F7384D|nr:AraC family transcriptional regulator [Pararhizobium sp. BT-229]MCV9962427.1 AraC family transcriptional regulator [Pararhizobium sp. BT-229]